MSFSTGSIAANAVTQVPILYDATIKEVLQQLRQMWKDEGLDPRHLPELEALWRENLRLKTPAAPRSHSLSGRMLVQLDGHDGDSDESDAAGDLEDVDDEDDAVLEDVPDAADDSVMASGAQNDDAADDDDDDESDAPLEDVDDGGEGGNENSDESAADDDEEEEEEEEAGDADAGADRPDDSAAGAPRATAAALANADDDDESSDGLGSFVSEESVDEDCGDNILIGFFESIKRPKGKYNVKLVNGLARIDGRELMFKECAGTFKFK